MDSKSITIACWKWEPRAGAPNTKKRASYSSAHVNAVFQMLKKNLTLPFRFICITDDSEGLDPEIGVIPLWEEFRHLGACFLRLVVFKKGFNLLGSRFFSIDLDVVITGNVDHIFSRDEAFLIWRPDENDLSRRSVQYCGSFFGLTAGARPEVYESFDPDRVTLNRNNRYSGGSDQKQISKVAEAVPVGQKEGIFNFMPDVEPLGGNLPENSCMVFFNGPFLPDDPGLSHFSWIREHYPLAGSGIPRYNPAAIRRKRERIKDKKRRTVNFVFYWWKGWPDGGNSLGLRYINNLASMIRRHAPEELNYKMILFTDRPDVEISGVQVRALLTPSDLRWNLHKMFMYSPQAELNGPVLCFDLDCVIVGDLDPLVKTVHQFGKRLITCAGAYQKKKIGGSIIGFKWQPRLTQLLWNPLLNAREEIEAQTKGSERVYFRQRLNRRQVTFWEKLIPGKVLSFKRDCAGGLPKGASVVRFHGRPRPHEVVSAIPWVKEMWDLTSNPTRINHPQFLGDI